MVCELCGPERWTDHLTAVRDYITDESFAIRRCAACGLMVTDPLVGDDVIDRYYPPRYRTDRQRQSGGLRVMLRAAAAQHEWRSGRSAAAPPRLLDIGCGTGAFALEMHRRGWQVAVTEINDTVLSNLRAQGLEARRPDDALRDGFAAPFDVITCWHVLEHVQHPMQVAKWARAQLAPGGIFQATVPNIASWQARVFGRDWLHLDVPRHRYHFTPATLRRLLHDAGFEILRFDTIAVEYDLFGVIQSALNKFCARPNVLFEHLTAHPDRPHALSPRSILVSYILAPWITAAAIPFTLMSALASRGATLTATCRVAGTGSRDPALSF